MSRIIWLPTVPRLRCSYLMHPVLPLLWNWCKRRRGQRIILDFSSHLNQIFLSSITIFLAIHLTRLSYLYFLHPLLQLPWNWWKRRRGKRQKNEYLIILDFWLSFKLRESFLSWITTLPSIRIAFYWNW